MGINTKTNTKSIIKLFAGACLPMLLASPSLAESVLITYEDKGTSIHAAGFHKLTIDGVNTYAMNAETKNPEPETTAGPPQ